MHHRVLALLCAAACCTTAPASAAEGCSLGTIVSFEQARDKMDSHDEQNLEGVLAATEGQNRGKKIDASIYVHSAADEGRTQAERDDLTRTRKKALEKWVLLHRPAGSSVRFIKPDAPPPNMGPDNYAIVDFKFPCRKGAGMDDKP